MQPASPNPRQKVWRNLIAGISSAGIIIGISPAIAQQQDTARQQLLQDRQQEQPQQQPQMQDRGQQQPQAATGSQDVQNIIANWPDISKKAANSMIQKYGKPDEATDSMLLWHNNGPWKRTIVSKEPVPHKFPMEHEDVLEQVIDYKVPADKFDELAKYDGSVIVERTKGEIAARCDKEAANFLAINLAHEIVEGDRDVESAREEYAKQVKAMMENKSAPLTQGLKFQKPTGETADAGEPSRIMQGGGTKPETGAGGKQQPARSEEQKESEEQ